MNMRQMRGVIKTQIVNRRQQVAELYLRGHYQTEIAEKLGVNQATISRDLAELRKEWLDRSVNHIDQKKAIELAKIDQLEITYWDAWERSQKNAESEDKEEIEIETPRGTTKRIKIFNHTAGQVGNPTFLQGIQWCISKRCEILGLDAPKRQEITGKNGEPLVGRTTEEYSRAVSALAQAIGGLLNPADAGQQGAVDTAEPPAVASPTESSG